MATRRGQGSRREHSGPAPELGRCINPVPVRDALPHCDQWQSRDLDHVEHRSPNQEARRSQQRPRLDRIRRDRARDAAPDTGDAEKAVGSAPDQRPRPACLAKIWCELRGWGTNWKNPRISDVTFLVAAADTVQTIYTECDEDVASPLPLGPHLK